MGVLTVSSAVAGEKILNTMPEKIPEMSAKLVQNRDGLPNAAAKLAAGKPLTIAYFGTSITDGGWWKFSSDWFKTNFPKSEINGFNAAIGSTGSEYGVFRLREHVLKYKPDLVFVEFSINDGSSGARDCRNVEGIVRQIWNENPTIDICIIHMFRPQYMAVHKKGLCSGNQSPHELIADYYGIPSINASLKIAELADSGKILLSQPKDDTGKPLPAPAGIPVYSRGDGVHAGDEGYKLLVDIMAEPLTKLCAAPAKPAPHVLKGVFVPDNFMENVKMSVLTRKMLSAGWKKQDVTNELVRKFGDASCYKVQEFWEAGQPGETIRFRFKGTTALIYDIMGPDAGQALITLDGKTLPPVSRFKTTHWPRWFTIGENLENTVHDVKIEIDSREPDRGKELAEESKKPGFDPDKFKGAVIRASRILVAGDLLDP